VQKVSLTNNNQIPYWANALIDMGEQFATSINAGSSRRQTLALCLPCINYAAILLGVGLLKASQASLVDESHQQRLTSLLGQWVIFEQSGNTKIGILELCQMTASFKIKLEKHGLWIMLNRVDWGLVKPIGREFNRNRRLNRQQIAKILAQNHSIRELSEVFGFHLWKSALANSGRLFSIFGNKTRLFQELTQPFLPNGDSLLVEILRPEGHLDYGNSSHCSIETNRSKMTDKGGALVIIEGGRNISDQIQNSQHLNKILLFARNSADYEKCINLVLENYTLRKGDAPPFEVPLPESIRRLQYYHQ